MRAKKAIAQLDRMIVAEAKRPAIESFFPLPERDDPPGKGNFLCMLNEALRENFDRYYVSKAEYAVSEYQAINGERQSGVRVVVRASAKLRCSPDLSDGTFQGTFKKEVWLERGGSVPEFIAKIESAIGTVRGAQSLLDRHYQLVLSTSGKES